MNSTGTGEALIQEVLAHPEDDNVRRVYADWLDDEGQHERAELIRTQLGLEALGDLDPGREQLLRRERELLSRPAAEWQGPPLPGLRLTYQRGFPDGVEGSLADLARHARALLRAAPVTRATLSGLEDSQALEKLKDVGLLGQLREVRILGQEATTAALADLLACCGRLRTLYLDGSSIGTDGVRALAEKLPSQSLRHLSLAAAGVNATSIEVLCRAEALALLESLTLDDNSLGSAATQLLVGARALGRLRHLSLARNRLCPTSARDLAHTAHLRGLASLDLSNNPLGHDGLVELARSPYLTHLEELGLARTHVTPPAMGHLSTIFSHLRRLSLAGNNLGSGGVEALRRCRACPPLEMLDLSGNEVGDEGARALGEWPALAGLRDLRLGVNGIRAFGLRPLLFSPHLGPLRRLTLDGNRCGDMGAQVLARWPGLKRLACLSLHNCGVADLGASELLEAVESLERLDLTACGLSPEVSARLRSAEEEGRIGTLLVD